MKDETDATPAEPPPPVLRVMRGAPTAEELAALIAVVAARAVGPGERTPHTRSAWNDTSRLIGGPFRAGPGGWRRSSLPR
jgi:Acyl-CoA carboxylase epsilon subunit